MGIRGRTLGHIGSCHAHFILEKMVTKCSVLSVVSIVHIMLIMFKSTKSTRNLRQSVYRNLEKK